MITSAEGICLYMLTFEFNRAENIVNIYHNVKLTQGLLKVFYSDQDILRSRLDYIIFRNRKDMDKYN